MACSLLCTQRAVIMADEHFWIEVEGENEAIFGIDVYHAYTQVRSKHLLEELAKDGVTLLAKNIDTSGPYSSGYTLRHIDHTDVNWDAGPEEYSGTVGIRAGTSYHPVYANRGTGEFGPFIKQPYTTKPPGGLMWFYGSRVGKRIGRESVRGQRAQHFL